MRILVVSQYFPPEVGATQNRMKSFVDGLLERGHELTVICEQPNHPTGVFAPGYGRRPVVTQRTGRLTVKRAWVMASPRKTTARRLAFYGSFAAAAAALVAGERGHDVVYSTSPPLPGVLACAGVARMRRMPLVVDVRDIWPAAAEALGELSSARALRAFERAERWLYRVSRAVTTTTVPFGEHIDRVAGRSVSVHLPNGALDELLALSPEPVRTNGRFTVGYAGNLGIAQGLDVVLDAAERLRAEDVRFVLVGDGPLREDLRARAGQRDLDKVEFRAPVPVSDAAGFMRSCDALLVPLGRHPLLGGFIPSKLYDAMAAGRPALVSAAGEPARLVEEHGCGISVEPENGDALADAVLRLHRDRDETRRLGSAGRAAAPEYARSKQVDRLERVLLAAAGHR